MFMRCIENEHLINSGYHGSVDTVTLRHHFDYLPSSSALKHAETQA